MRNRLVLSKYFFYAKEYGNRAKIANAVLNKTEYALGKRRLSSKPFKVTIDPGNVCNLRCPGCHTGIKHPDMCKPKMLRYGDFVTLFDQVKDSIFSVALYNWGEPFLNKRIFDMIAYSSANKTGSTVHSNFNHFNEQMAVEAVKSGLTHMYLSIDGSTQGTYSRYRVQGHLPTVLENLKIMIETKKRMGSIYPLITWKFLEFEHNKHEVFEAQQMAEAIGVDNFESFPAYAGLNDIYSLTATAMEKTDTVYPGKCHSLWNSMYLGSDGSVFPCSLAFRPSESFGNLLTHTLQDIWNSEKYQVARGMHSSGEAPPYPCAGCLHYLTCKSAKH